MHTLPAGILAANWAVIFKHFKNAACGISSCFTAERPEKVEEKRRATLMVFASRKYCQSCVNWGTLSVSQDMISFLRIILLSFWRKVKLA